MKKRISIAGLVIIAIYFIQMNTSAYLGKTIADGFVFSNEENILEMKKVDSRIDSIELNEFKANKEIFGTSSKISIENDENNVEFSSNFPLLINGGKSIHLIKDNAGLIDSNLVEGKTTVKQVVTDGILFDESGNIQDVNSDFTLAKLPNGLMMNLQKMQFTIDDQTSNFGSNSVVFFDENYITAFNNENGEFSYSKITNINKSATIKIGDHSWNYQTFLKKTEVLRADSSEALADAEDTTNDSTDGTNGAGTNGSGDGSGDGFGDGSGVDGSEVDGSGTDGDADGNGSSFDKDYVAPNVSVEEFVANNYSLQTNMTIVDPNNTIDKSAFITIKEEDELIIRRPVKKTGPIEILGLKPGTEYSVEVMYEFENAQGINETVILKDFTIQTKDFATIGDLSLDYNVKNIEERKVVVENLKANQVFTNDIISNIETFTINLNERVKYVLSFAQYNDLLTGKEISIDSGNILVSNTDYMINFEAVDKYGNQFVITNEEVPYKTAKKQPKIRIVSSKVEFDNAEQEYTIENPDNATLTDLAYELYDIDNKLIKTEKIDLNTNKFKITNLISRTNYKVFFKATYDLNNDLGFVTEEIGNSSLVTVPLSSFGSVFLTSRTDALTSQSVNYNVTLDLVRTNKVLISLMDEIVISLKNQQGDEVYSKKLNQTEIQAFKNGTTINNQVARLSANTNYRVEIRATAREFTQVTDLRISNNINEIITFKNPPTLVINDNLFIKNKYTMNYTISDEFGTIGNKRYNVELININTKESLFSELYDKLDNVTLSYDIYNKTINYGIRITALEYNIGRTAATLERNKVVFERPFNARNSLVGKMELNSFEKMENDSTAKIKISVDDKAGYIRDETFYLEVYKNGVLSQTKPYKLTNGGFNSVESLKVDNDATYNIKLLFFSKNKKIILSEDTFDTSETIYTITNEDEFFAIESDKKYRVINNINFSNDTRRIDKQFNGEIDFNGYELKIPIQRKGYLFKLIGEDAKLQNLNYELFGSFGRNQRDSSLIIENRGKITNVNGKYSVDIPEAYRFEVSGFANKNFGTIENFSMISTKPLYGEQRISFFVVENNGLISNGSVFGEKIFGTQGSSTNNRSIAGAVAVNGSRGIVRNVVSNIDAVGNGSRISPNIGSIVGQSSGIVENTYSVTTGLVNGHNTAGPSIGSNTNSRSKNNYYFSPDPERNDYNKKIISQSSVLDPLTISEIINGTDQFDVDSPVLNGFYPQVKLGDKIDAPLFKLPERENKDSVDILSSKVISINEQKDGAVVEIRVDNPSQARIESVRVDGMISKVTNQVNEKNASRVTVDLKASDLFVTNYSIRNIIFNDGRVTRSVSYGIGERIIEMSLFKTVNNINDLKIIETNSNTNFIIATDLNYLNTKFVVESEYTGIIEGNGYTISNIVTPELLLFKKGLQNADIRDLTFDNVTLGDGLTGVSVIGSSVFADVNNSTIDNVFLKNVQVNASNNIAVFASTIRGSKISNIGVSSSTINVINETTDLVSGNIGGFALAARDSSFNNVFVNGLKIDSQDFTTKKVSGFINVVQDITVTDSYVSDVAITGERLDEAAGAIYTVQNSDNVSIKNSYFYVDINGRDMISNLFGQINNVKKMDVLNVLMLGNSELTGRNFDRVVLGQTNSPEFNTKIFSTNIQFINGGNAKHPLITDIDIKRFNQAATYRDVIGLGEMFDYSKSSEIKVPLLYNSEKTALLPNQAEITIKFDSFFLETLRVVTSTNNLVTLEFTMSNPNNFEINDFQIEDMVAVSGVKLIDPELKTYQQSYRPTKYWDEYNLTKISYIDKGSKETNLRYPFELILYKEIWTVDDYNELSERRDQNAVIMQDIDFTGQPVENQLRLNRLIAANKKISGIVSDNFLYRYVGYVNGLTFDNIQTINSIFYNINNSLTNTTFSNVTINQTNTNNGHAMVSNTRGTGKEMIFQNITLENNNINVPTRSGVGELIGILDGSADIKVMNVSSVNAKIAGTNRVGGILGMITQNNVFLEQIRVDKLNLTGNSVIGGIVGVQPGLNYNGISNNLYLTNSTITAAGDVAGGIIGEITQGSNLKNVGVSSSRIKGKEFVGGIFAKKLLSSFNYNNMYVLDTNLEGTRYVGGAFGGVNGGRSSVNNMIVNANVKSNTSVGLVSGHHLNTLYKNIIASGTAESLTGAGSVLGVFPRTNSSLENFINAGSSFIGKENPTLYNGFSTSGVKNYRAFNGMSLNGLLMKDSPDFGFAQGSTAQIQKFDTINLTSANYYSNLDFTVTNWDFSGIGANKFPKIKDADNNTVLPFQVDVDLPSTVTSRSRRSTSQPEKQPEVKENTDASTNNEISDNEITAYFSAADTLNLDITPELEQEKMQIYIGDELVYDKEQNERTISLQNSQLKDIKVVLVDKNSEKIFNPRDYINKITMIGDKYYYLNDGKLFDSEKVILENVANVYENTALLETGEVVNIETMESSEQAAPKVLSRSISLKNNGNTRTFGTYSTVDDVVKDDLLLYKNKNEIDIIQYSPENNIDKVVINTDIQSVLTKSGEIDHLRTPFNAPKEFVNANVEDIAVNDQVISVLYDDAKVMSFDYLSGELIQESTNNVQRDFGKMISSQISNIFKAGNKEKKAYNDYKQIDTFLEENSNKVNLGDTKFENKMNLQNKFQIVYNDKTKSYDIYDINKVLSADAKKVEPIDQKKPEFTNQVLLKINDTKKVNINGVALIISVLSIILVGLCYHKRNIFKR
ncbi:MAG: hypothetical protein ACRCUP_01185 [Mycoplasmatales bacterium]